MSKKIKNTFIKLVSDPVKIIKGRSGYHTNIKDIYVNNNSTTNIFLSIYILDIDQKRTYVCNNITIPSKNRFEIPHDGNIELENKEYIFAEVKKKPTDVDIFCNYIETEKTLNTLDIIFKDQNSVDVSGISWSVSDTDDGKKLIKFAESSIYSLIPDITYQIVGQKVIIYKTPNLKILLHDFEEYEDRYEVDYYSKKENIFFNNFLTQSFINVSFNISSFWRYTIGDIYTDLNIWNTSDVEIDITPNTYSMNFKDVDGYTKPTDCSITILPDNLIELNFEYISNNGLLKVITDYNINNLEWVLIDGYGGEDLSDVYYLNSLVSLEEGTHTIKIRESDVFNETEFQIFINKNQMHYLQHNMNFVNAQLQIDLENTIGTNVWQINDINDFSDIDTWYSTTDVVFIDEGEYFINFKDITNHIKPETQLIVLNNNVKTILTTKYIENTGLITISKPSLLEDVVASGIKWRLTNKDTQVKTEWFVYDVITTIVSGEYYIEFQKVEDYFESFISSVKVYSNQKTTYIMNNSILL